MKRNILVLFILPAAFFMLQTECIGQRPRKKSEQIGNNKESFLEKQWWIGMRGGINLTQAHPVEQYSVFSSTDQQQDSYKKEYKNYKPGAVAGIEVTFSYKFLSLSFQPAYKRHNFSYTNKYQWSNDSLKASLSLEYIQEHKLDYLQFPLFLKVDFLSGSFKPFIQAGGFYSTLIGAEKSVYTSGKDEASGGVEFEGTPVKMGVKDLFIRSNVGYVFGLGFNWNPGNVRIILDANYFRGTSNITDRAARYTNNQLAGSGDVLDDIKLRSYSINLACVFPMRYLLVNKATTGKKSDKE
jgi:hypothetical protein